MSHDPLSDKHPDVQAAVRALTASREALKAGQRFAMPWSLTEASRLTLPWPAVEAVVINRSRAQYAVQYRPDDEPHFGQGIHVIGGGLKLPKKDAQAGPIADGTWMAIHEAGFQEVRFLIGPIATYAWQPGEHLHGCPFSMVYVFEQVGDDPTPVSGQGAIVWFDMGDVPLLPNMIKDRFGVVHLAFLKVLNAWWRHDQMGLQFSSIDLNGHPGEYL